MSLQDPRPDDLLPRTLRGVTIERLLVEDGHPYDPRSHWSRTSLEFTAHPDSIELFVTEALYPQAIVKKGTREKRHEFYEFAGRFHQYFVPEHLMRIHDAAARHLGLQELAGWKVHYHLLAYQPNGPWEYIPPDNPWDYRGRARWNIPVRPTDKSMTKLALATVVYWRRARITVDYNQPERSCEPSCRSGRNDVRNS